jgi:hypothetical protein
MEDVSPPLVGIHGLAACLKLKAQWLKVEALAGRIPCLKVGRHLMFNPEAVALVLKKRAAVETCAPSEPQEVAHA